MPMTKIRRTYYTSTDCSTFALMAFSLGYCLIMAHHVFREMECTPSRK